MKTVPAHNIPKADVARLLTYMDLGVRWGEAEDRPLSPRQVRRVCIKIGLKPLDLGHRTKRFRPADVHRAEERAAGVSRRASFVL
ncbi:MAG: hypothetical protein QM496_13800 [Verrucomicrobiota bacterium]